MNAVIKEIDREQKTKAYLSSISVAKLAHIVVSGLGGEKAARNVKMEDLLPFKLADIFDQSDTDCTPRTISVIKKLVKSGRMPLVLIPVLRAELDE